MADPLEQLSFAEAEQIDGIRELEGRYRAEFGRDPFDLSHWDSGPEYRGRVGGPKVPGLPHDPFAYLYSYELPEEKARVLQKLGYTHEDARVILAPSATAACYLVACFLRHVGLRRVSVLCPTYFAISLAHEMLGVEVAYVPAWCGPDAYHLPDGIEAGQTPALWLTDPLYSVGTPLRECDRGRLRRLTAAGAWLVCDQTLARPAEALGPSLAWDPRLISIHSPHKSLGVNAFKFAAIVCDRGVQAFFENWADVVYGSLAASNLHAIRHFLSEDFDAMQARAIDCVRGSLAFLHDAVAAVPGLRTDRAQRGFFVSCYAPRLPSRFAEDAGTLWRLMRDSGASIIPGTRNRMPDEAGFSFRVNLTRDRPSFRGALVRLLRWIASADPA